VSAETPSSALSRAFAAARQRLATLHGEGATKRAAAPVRVQLEALGLRMADGSDVSSDGSLGSERAARAAAAVVAGGNTTRGARGSLPSSDGSIWLRASAATFDGPYDVSRPPIPVASAHPPRREEESRARAAYAHTCLLQGSEGDFPRGVLGAHARRPAFLPTPPREVDVEKHHTGPHCFSVNAALQSWLKDEAARNGLSQRYPTRMVEWGDGGENVFGGPWIEDAFANTFMRPVEVEMTAGGFLNLVKDGYVGVRVVNASSGGQLPIAAVADLVRAQGAAVPVLVHFPFDADLFDPWCPLFLPWENLFSHSMATHTGWGPVERLAELLYIHLRPDRQYLTVVQRAAGPLLIENPTQNAAVALSQALRNVLVLSSGGTGHVPLPLLGRELPLPAPSPRRPSHAFAFVGADSHQGDYQRSALAADMRANALVRDGIAIVETPTGLEAAIMDEVSGLELLRGWSLLPPGGVKEREQEVAASALAVAANPFNWALAMVSSAYALAPRGTGPTSFRLYEALQLGVPPVYVHSGVPWLPYVRRGSNTSVWSSIAHVIEDKELPRFLARLEGAWRGGEEEGLRSAPPALPHVGRVTRAAGLRGTDPSPPALPPSLPYAAMRASVRRVRGTHFTYAGTMAHIAEWLHDPFTSELDCAPSAGQ